MSDSDVNVTALAALLANAGSNPEQLERVLRSALASSFGDEAAHSTHADLRHLSDSLNDNVNKLYRINQDYDGSFRSVDFMVRSFRNEANAYQRIFVKEVSRTNVLLTATIVLVLIVLAFELFPDLRASLSGRSGVPMAITCSPNGSMSLPDRPLHQ